MRYTVNTEKARRIYRRFKSSTVIMGLAFAIFCVATVASMLFADKLHGVTAGYVVLGITCLSGLMSSVFALVYLSTRNHVAVPYIEVIDYQKPKILGMGMRNPTGSHGYDGLQEVYFIIEDEQGREVHRVLGLVKETTKHHLDSPMIDITEQLVYI